ncbi:hypothetical protein PR048_030313 [Dryococelus australis]|uniref:Uncharacterized protein n=1 Tax=Dryococelus australis TaxID=614101 RepID=A0ABQ9G938_9NEOP|nr:hypothetical protein PR048_030313 [Dryococelus australis]
MRDHRKEENLAWEHISTLDLFHDRRFAKKRVNLFGQWRPVVFAPLGTGYGVSTVWFFTGDACEMVKDLRLRVFTSVFLIFLTHGTVAKLSESAVWKTRMSADDTLPSLDVFLVQCLDDKDLVRRVSSRLMRTACLITPSKTELGHERDCNNTLRKASCRNPLHEQVTRAEYVKQRADIGQRNTGRVVFRHRAIATRRARRWVCPAVDNRLPEVASGTMVKAGAFQRGSEMSMEQRRIEGAGVTGDPREYPPTSGIVRHDSHSDGHQYPLGGLTKLKFKHPIILQHALSFRPLDQVAGNNVTERHVFRRREHHHKLVTKLAGDCAALRLLSSWRGKPGSILGGNARGFSRVGIVPDDAIGRCVSLGISHFFIRFPRNLDGLRNLSTPFHSEVVFSREREPNSCPRGEQHGPFDCRTAVTALPYWVFIAPELPSGQLPSQTNPPNHLYLDHCVENFVGKRGGGWFRDLRGHNNGLHYSTRANSHRCYHPSHFCGHFFIASQARGHVAAGAGKVYPRACRDAPVAEKRGVSRARPQTRGDLRNTEMFGLPRRLYSPGGGSKRGLTAAGRRGRKMERRKVC